MIKDVKIVNPSNKLEFKKIDFLDGYKKHKMLTLMLMIGVIWYVIFKYLPMYGLIISFKDLRILDGIKGSPWVGLKHFKFAFGSTDFWNVFRNTLIISGMKLLINFPAPIIFALLLNEVRNATFKKVTQTISYLPHFLSWVVLGGVIINFLSPTSGLVNVIIKGMGFQPIYFVASKDWFRKVLVGSSLWKDIGWSSIVYLAALAGVDQSLYEAATVDGANKFKKMIHVTLPSISPIVVVMMIFAVGKVVNDDFDQVFNLINPAVYSVGDVLSTYIYKVGLENMRYSYSAAIEFFKNSISFALVMTTNHLAKKYSDYGLF